MSANLPSVQIKKETFTNLYAATGISVGTKIIVQNIGNNNASLYEKSSQPVVKDGHNILERNKFLASTPSPVGLWAHSIRNTVLQVEEA